MIRENVRVYGRVKNISAEELKAAFASIPYVNLAVLFGSRCGGGTEQVRSQSDYDFAVLLDKTSSTDWGHLARLRVEIGSLLGLPDEDFDLVDLEIATPQMLASVAGQYELLKGNVDELRGILNQHRSNC